MDALPTHTGNDDKARQQPRLWALIVAVLVVAVYVLVFFSIEIESLGRAFSERFMRIQIFTFLKEPVQLMAAWFGEPGDAAILDRLPVFIPALLIVLFASVVGWWLMSLVRADRQLSALEVVVFAAGVGLNAVSLVTLLLGLAGCLNVWCFAAPAIAALAAAAWRFHRLRQSGSRLAQRHWSESESSRELSSRWLWLALPACLCLVLGGMLPPVDFDVREYHLQAPKEFYQQGAIRYLPHNAYAQMPLGAEMHALLAMMLLDDWWLGALVGKTVIALIAPLTALASFSLGRRFFGATTGIVAAVVYLTLPWTARVSMSGLIDGVVGFYCLLAIYAVMLVYQNGSSTESSSANRRGLTLLAGFLAGSAVACKYPAAVFVLLPLLAVVVLRSTRSADGSWKNIAVFMIASLIACGPWFGKNLVFTGNSTYPLLNGALGGSLQRSEADRRWRAAHRPKSHNGQTGWAAYRPTELARSAADVLMFSPWHGPVLVPLALIAFFSRCRSERIVRWSFFYMMVVLTVWWFATHRIDRFWVPIVPIAAVMAGVGAAWSDRTAWRWTVVSLLLVSTLYGFTLAATSAIEGTSGKFFVALRILRRDPNRLPAYHGYLNDRHSQVGGVLLVGGAQPFDLEIENVFYNTTFDPSQLLSISATEWDPRWALTKKRITHILVAWDEIDRYRSPGNYGFEPRIDKALFDAWVDAGIVTPLDKADAQGRHRLYKVAP